MKRIPPGKYVGTKNEYIAVCPETKALRLDDSRKDQFRVVHIGNKDKFKLYWNNNAVRTEYDVLELNMHKIDDWDSRDNKFCISMDQEGGVILHYSRFKVVCQDNNILCGKYDDECEEPLKFQFIKA